MVATSWWAPRSTVALVDVAPATGRATARTDWLLSCLKAALANCPAVRSLWTPRGRPAEHSPAVGELRRMGHGVRVAGPAYVPGSFPFGSPQRLRPCSATHVVEQCANGDGQARVRARRMWARRRPAPTARTCRSIISGVMSLAARVRRRHRQSRPRGPPERARPHNGGSTTHRPPRWTPCERGRTWITEPLPWTMVSSRPSLVASTIDADPQASSSGLPSLGANILARTRPAGSSSQAHTWTGSSGGASRRASNPAGLDSCRCWVLGDQPDGAYSHSSPFSRHTSSGPAFVMKPVGSKPLGGDLSPGSDG
jgi:hypothetical protein